MCSVLQRFNVKLTHMVKRHPHARLKQSSPKQQFHKKRQQDIDNQLPAESQQKLSNKCLVNVIFITRPLIGILLFCAGAPVYCPSPVRYTWLATSLRTDWFIHLCILWWRLQSVALVQSVLNVNLWFWEPLMNKSTRMEWGFLSTCKLSNELNWFVRETYITRKLYLK